MTPPSDALIASYCGLIYKPTALISGFDYFDGGMETGVCWALKRLPGFDLLIFRGTKTLPEWITDIRALAIPTRIGHVHAGFFSGMEKVWSDVRPMLEQPAVLGGHSLGAAHADMMAGLMTVDGAPPASRVVFGEPKPGLEDFALIVKDVPANSYRNGDNLHHDQVTDVPFSFPPLQYMHPTPIVPVCEPPTGDLFATMGIFAWHHEPLYFDGAEKLGITTTKEIA